MTKKQLVLSKEIPISDANLNVKYFVTHGEIPFKDRVLSAYGLAIEQQDGRDPQERITEEHTGYFIDSLDEALRLAQWMASNTVTPLSMLAVLSDLKSDF